MYKRQTLADAIWFDAPSHPEAQAGERALVYGGERVLAQEAERERAQEAVLVEMRHLFVDGPILSLPVGQSFQYSFDPNHVQPLDDLGSVFRNVQVVDDWGRIDCSGGILLRRNADGSITSLSVPAPPRADGTLVQGDGWELSLNEGWAIEPGTRPGDYRVAPR